MEQIEQMGKMGIIKIKSRNKVLKTLKLLFFSVLGLVLVMVGLFIVIYFREVSTLNTIARPDVTVDFFTMEYKGDYGFDEFLVTGASNDQELINYITQRLMKGLPFEMAVPDFACSTFSVKSPSGEQLFGRNFDLDYSPALLVETNPDDGYRSYSMVNLALTGYTEDYLPTSMINGIMALAAPYLPMDGVNEKGLAIGVLMIGMEPVNQQTSKPDITTTTAIRMVLDYCANVDEAIAMLEQYDMHASANCNYHFQIADASGKSVVVEYINDQMNSVESQQATNFLLTEGYESIGVGQDRFAILEETIAQTDGILSEEDSMELLSAVEMNDSDIDVYTQWSVVYNQTQNTFNIVIDAQYDKVFSYSFEPNKYS